MPSLVKHLERRWAGQVEVVHRNCQLVEVLEAEVLEVEEQQQVAASPMGLVA